MKDNNEKERHTKENLKVAKIIFIIGFTVIIIAIISVFVWGLYNKKNSRLSSYEEYNVELEEYNNIFSKYSGQYVEGTKIKQLINDVISSNNKYTNEKGKFISIGASNIRNFDSSNLSHACTAARLNNTKENIDLANQSMDELIKIIDDAKMYSVFFEKTNNRVTNIDISVIQN